MKEQVVNTNREFKPNIVMIIVAVGNFCLIELTLLALLIFGIIKGSLRAITVVIMIFIFLVFLGVSIWYYIKYESSVKAPPSVLSTQECFEASRKILFFRERFAETKDKSDKYNREIFRYVGSGSNQIPVYVRSVRSRWDDSVAVIIMRADDVIVDSATGTKYPRQFSIGYDIKDEDKIDSLCRALVPESQSRSQLVKDIMNEVLRVQESVATKKADVDNMVVEGQKI